MPRLESYIVQWVNAVELVANDHAEGFDLDDLTLAALDATILRMVNG